MHWASQYVGQKWTENSDCFYWYRRIKREVFGRDVPICEVDHGRLVSSAARIMDSDITGSFGYRKTETAREGDAVFMSQRTRPHHLGMAVILTSGLHVLHALEGSGVICSDMTDLKLNGWTINGYWTDED